MQRLLATICIGVLLGIERVIHMKTKYVGPDEMLVAAKRAITPGSFAVEIAEAINAAETSVRAKVPVARVIYLEPDIDRGTPAESKPDGRESLE